MLFQRTLLSCLLAGEITARTLQETLLEDTLIARTAAAEKPSNLVEPPQKALPTATYGLQARAEAIPAPTQSGIANNCDNYYKVISGDTCIGIAYQHSIALSQFYSWNPAVGSNCQVLLAGYYVCVGVSETVATTSPTSISTTSSPPPPPPPTNTPEPTQPGIASDCTEYYEAQPGDTCISIVQKYRAQGSSITLSAFEKWNPAVGKDCTDLLVGYFYCVATPPAG